MTVPAQGGSSVGVWECLPCNLTMHATQKTAHLEGNLHMRIQREVMQEDGREKTLAAVDRLRELQEKGQLKQRLLGLLDQEKGEEVRIVEEERLEERIFEEQTQQKKEEEEQREVSEGRAGDAGKTGQNHATTTYQPPVKDVTPWECDVCEITLKTHLKTYHVASSLHRRNANRREDEERQREQANIEERRIKEEKWKEAMRFEEEERLKQQGRKIGEQRIAEEGRLAEERRVAEEKRVAEELIIAQEIRIAEERKIRVERKIAEVRRMEEERRIAEEVRITKERITVERILAEVRRVAEEKRIEEVLRTVEETRIAEERRIAAERRVMEERRVAEGRRIAEVRRIGEEIRIAEERRTIVERRMEEVRTMEERRKEEERQSVEQMIPEAKGVQDTREGQEGRKDEAGGVEMKEGERQSQEITQFHDEVEQAQKEREAEQQEKPIREQGRVTGPPRGLESAAPNADVQWQGLVGGYPEQDYTRVRMFQYLSSQEGFQGGSNEQNTMGVSTHEKPHFEYKEQMLHGQMLQGQMLHEPILQGQISQGPILQGQMLQGQMLQGQMLLGQMPQGQMLQGQMLQGQMLQDKQTWVSSPACFLLPPVSSLTDLPPILYRVYDESSVSQYTMAGFNAGSPLLPNNLSQFKTMVECHGNWRSRVRTPFISVTTNPEKARWHAANKLATRRYTNPMVALIDTAILVTTCRSLLWKMHDAMDHFGLEPVTCHRRAYDDEYICALRIPAISIIACCQPHYFIDFASVFLKNRYSQQ